MNSRSYDSISSNANSGAAVAADSAEATLRMIAQLSAPEGLEERVKERLRIVPRGSRVLQWPTMLHPGSSWMRGMAAAAIVFVVAGGGWGIYTRVLPSQPGKVIAMPRSGVGGGFSSAGAMRTPQTLKGPVVTEPVAQPVQAKPLKKAPARTVAVTRSQTQPGGRKNTSVQAAGSGRK
jgi:hypothetical protein